MRLFPFTSLFARQCAVDYEDVVPVHADVARDFVRVPHVTVTLGPGDMLYLPPYWVHRVVTESAVSVSVNAWSDVLEAYQLDSQLMQLPLPLDPHWGWSARIAATRTWLRDHVYSKVATLLRMEWDVFVPRHLRNRWALVPLMPCQADVDVASDPAHELDPVKAAACNAAMRGVHALAHALACRCGARCCHLPRHGCGARCAGKRAAGVGGQLLRDGHSSRGGAQLHWTRRGAAVKKRELHSKNQL